MAVGVGSGVVGVAVGDVVGVVDGIEVDVGDVVGVVDGIEVDVGDGASVGAKNSSTPRSGLSPIGRGCPSISTWTFVFTP